MVTKYELKEQLDAAEVAIKRKIIIMNTYDMLHSFKNDAMRSQLIRMAENKSMPTTDLFYGLSYLRLNGHVGMKLVEKTDKGEIEMCYWLNSKHDDGGKV